MTPIAGFLYSASSSVVIFSQQPLQTGQSVSLFQTSIRVDQKLDKTAKI